MTDEKRDSAGQPIALAMVPYVRMPHLQADYWSLNVLPWEVTLHIALDCGVITGRFVTGWRWPR